MCDCDLTKQIVLLLLWEAARCCRASLEWPAFPSDSNVSLFLYSVICYGKYFNSDLHKFLCDYYIKSQYMYNFM